YRHGVATAADLDELGLESLLVHECTRSERLQRTAESIEAVVVERQECLASRGSVQRPARADITDRTDDTSAGYFVEYQHRVTDGCFQRGGFAGALGQCFQERRNAES